MRATESRRHPSDVVDHPSAEFVVQSLEREPAMPYAQLGAANTAPDP